MPRERKSDWTQLCIVVMPIVTLTLRAPKLTEFKAGLLDAIQAALVDIGAHPDDLFHRVLELPEEDFRFHPTFPDVRTLRTQDFVLAEILLGTGRSVKLKKQLLAGIVERLSARGFDPENLMVVFHDVPWENFSPAGGRLPHA
jgi:phenylpyruvate tautomerase PptA (4-oxalocrotonate tautomerase family)